LYQSADNNKQGELRLTLLNDILTHNQEFVEQKHYRPYKTDKFPQKRLVVISCMDTRLMELLPKAMDVHNGDVKIIKTAGAIVSHPFGSVMRSVLVAIYELGAEEVCIVGHYDCGMSSLKTDNMLDKMKERGVSQENLDLLAYAGVHFEEFLGGFDCVEDSVRHSVSMVAGHPLLPKEIAVHGLLIDPKTGTLDVGINGYETAKT
jgi:carbonic anhydrase